jgi:hypothetical protein
MVKVIETTEEGYTTESMQYVVLDGAVEINLKKISAVVLKSI